MNTLHSTLGRRFRTGLLAVAAVAVVAGASLAPALADGRYDGRHEGWHDRGWGDRDWHDHDDYRFAPRGYVYGGYPAPYYGYYGYTPAPVYPAPGLNFGVTIR